MVDVRRVFLHNSGVVDGFDHHWYWLGRSFYFDDFLDCFYDWSVNKHRNVSFDEDWLRFMNRHRNANRYTHWNPDRNRDSVVHFNRERFFDNCNFMNFLRNFSFS